LSAFTGLPITAGCRTGGIRPRWPERKSENCSLLRPCGGGATLAADFLGLRPEAMRQRYWNYGLAHCVMGNICY
jgi:hypothetical protein